MQQVGHAIYERYKIQDPNLLPVKLSNGFPGRAVNGVYATHIDDWTNTGLEGRKLQEFEDIYHCAKVFRDIIEQAIEKE